MIRILMMALFLVLLGAPLAARAECREGKGGQTAGTVIGGALGGWLGNKIGGRGDRRAGTLIGVVGGALIGNALGKALDRCEQKQLADATSTALDSDGGRPQSWKSGSRANVSGTTVASPAVSAPDGRVCRTVTRVNYVDGQEMQDKPTFCRVPPDATWAMAAV